MNLRITVPIFLLIAALAADADGPVLIGPDQIVREAMDHSLSLQSADQDVKAAAARQSQARAQGLPSVDVDARATRYNGLEDAVLGPEMVIPAVDDRYGASIGVRQALYTGGRITQQKASAQYSRRAAEESRRGTESEVILQSFTAYWNWSKAFSFMESLRAAVARMEAHDADMKHLLAAGMATDNDALATEVLLEQTRLRFEEAQRRVDVAKARVAFLTGRELPAAAVPQQADGAMAVNVPPESALVDMAGTNRAEILSGQLSAKSAAAQADVARAELYPQITLSARYEHARPNLMDFPLAEEWNDDVFAGVVLTWSLFDFGLTRDRAREAAARAEQARLQLCQTEERVVLEVREARADLQDAVSRRTVAARAEQSALRNLERSTDLWKNGLARHSDVLDAHAQLTDTQNEQIAAAADVMLSQANLAYAVGRLQLRASDGK